MDNTLWIGHLAYLILALLALGWLRSDYKLARKPGKVKPRIEPTLNLKEALPESPRDRDVFVTADHKQVKVYNADLSVWVRHAI